MKANRIRNTSQHKYSYALPTIKMLIGEHFQKLLNHCKSIFHKRTSSEKPMFCCFSTLTIFLTDLDIIYGEYSHSDGYRSYRLTKSTQAEKSAQHD